MSSACAYGPLTLYGRPSQIIRLQLPYTPAESFYPAHLDARFGLFHFRSPLLAESSLFLALLRCFSSSGSPPAFQQDDEV